MLLPSSFCLRPNNPTLQIYIALVYLLSTLIANEIFNSLFYYIIEIYIIEIQEIIKFIHFVLATKVAKFAKQWLFFFLSFIFLQCDWLVQKNL